MQMVVTRAWEVKRVTDRCGLKENLISLKLWKYSRLPLYWMVVLVTHNKYLTIAKRSDLKCYHHKDKYMRWWI